MRALLVWAARAAAHMRMGTGGGTGGALPGGSGCARALFRVLATDQNWDGTDRHDLGGLTAKQQSRNATASV